MRRLSPRPDAVLLVRPEHGQQVVSAACPRSQRAGVRAGLSLAHARVLLAGWTPHVEEEDRAGDENALRALARWAARRWSPIVGMDGVDGLLLDTTGCDHLFGGEEGLVGSVRRGVRGLGLTPRIALASTIGAAWAVARFADLPGHARDAGIIAPGTERQAIAPLPTPALRLDPDAVDSLAEVGIERVGQVLDVARGALPSRYGPELLHRIDQALGQAYEGIERVGEEGAIEAWRELAGGTTRLESVEGVVRLLLEEIVGTLAARESALRGLDATFERLGGEARRLSIRVAQPTRDAKHLWSLLRPHVERLDMGCGVERASLRVVGCVRVAHRQGSLAGDDAWRSDREVGALLDTLASRLGRERLFRVEPEPRHHPERSFRCVPADEGDPRAAPACSPPGPRPSRLIDPPAPAQAVALSPDGPILRLRWARHEHQIRASVGPERIGPQWWTAREPTRDYYRVQDERGRWLWVFRELDSSRWFVHGEWS